MFRALDELLPDLCRVVRIATQATRLVLRFPFGEPVEIDLETALAMHDPGLDAVVDRFGGLSQLEAIAERTEALLRMVPESTAVIDEDGAVLASNSNMFSPGQDLKNVVPPERWSAALQYFSTVAASGKAVFKRDGTVRVGRTNVPCSVEIAPCGDDLLLLCQPTNAVRPPIREVQDA